MQTWSHPKLGLFHLDDDQYIGKCTLPSFATFRYLADGCADVPLEFETSQNLPPSQDAINLATLMIDNEKLLASKTIETLSCDFNGQGPNSGMWWRNDHDSIREMMDDDIPTDIDLADPASVAILLGSPRIWIRSSVPFYEGTCAVIAFDAAFDLEHGVGVLTNGTDIIGIGYQMSVSPYRQFRNRG